MNFSFFTHLGQEISIASPDFEKLPGICKKVFLESPFYLQKGASKVKINPFFGPFLLNTKHLAWSAPTPRTPTPRRLGEYWILILLSGSLMNDNYNSG